MHCQVSPSQKKLTTKYTEKTENEKSVETV